MKDKTQSLVKKPISLGGSIPTLFDLNCSNAQDHNYRHIDVEDMKDIQNEEGIEDDIYNGVGTEDENDDVHQLCVVGKEN